MLGKRVMVCETWPAASSLLHFWVLPTESVNIVVGPGACQMPMGTEDVYKACSHVLLLLQVLAAGCCPSRSLAFGTEIVTQCSNASRFLIFYLFSFFLFNILLSVLWQGVVVIASFMVRIYRDPLILVMYLKKGLRAHCWCLSVGETQLALSCQPCLEVRSYRRLNKYLLL